MNPLLTMAGLKRLQAGFAVITKAEFAQVVKATLQTDDGYVDQCWPDFSDNPLSYCLSRRPESQGNALVELAAQKARLLPGDTQPASEARVKALEDALSELMLAVQRDQGCSARLAGAKCHECPPRLERAMAKAKSLFGSAA